MLQEEDGVEIGWLLYSTREMDSGALADEIGAKIGVNIGLRWKVINTGTRSINKENMVRALIVECSSKVKWHCQAKLLQLYSRAIKTVKDYPNGVRLRFVKMRKAGVNTVEKSKMDKLRERQKTFLSNVCTARCEDIVMLDYSKHPGVIPTLRQMIMDLKSSGSEYPLFHSVDLDWRLEGFTLQHSPELVDEVETTITTLLPLLTHLYPDADVPASFTEDAAHKTQSMKWCDKKQMIIDTLSQDETEDITLEENLMGFVFDLEALHKKQSRPSPTSKEKAQTFHPQDDDSISTLKSMDGTIRSTLTRPPESTVTTLPPGSAHSHTSMSTTQSLEHLDRRITGLTGDMLIQQQQNVDKFEAILNAINNINTHTSNRNDQSSGNTNSSTRSGSNTSGSGL